MDHDAVFDAIREARVGGQFWLSPGAGDPWVHAGTIVADLDDERAIVAWLAGARVHDLAGRDVPPEVLRRRAIAAIEGATYRDPFSGMPTDARGAVALLATWRRTCDANRAIAAVAGMASWKRKNVARLLWNGVDSPPFLSGRRAIRRAVGGRADGGAARAIAYWPSRTDAATLRLAECGSIPTWQVEDGFLRSAGLGVECRPPFSLLVDRTGGIHFDPRQPSELEDILASAKFPPDLLARAAALRERIVRERIGKYGVERGAPTVDLPAGRRIVLAIGQVGDDLSVRFGGGAIEGNLAFLRHVRAREPDAFVLYRPHPDVVAGLRRGHVPDDIAEGIADRVDGSTSLLALIERVDAVHVLSSLTGFEALLRGCDVVVHGMPFYAGWGLTTDLADLPARRERRLSLDELVAGALILAPRYLDPRTGLPCAVEILVDRMVEQAADTSNLLTGFRRIMGAVRRTATLAAEALR